MSGCGHRCCEIPSNSYHTHTGPPAVCGRCASAIDPVAGSACADQTGAAGGEQAEPGAPESYLLGRIVADVVARVVPQIPGLPSGTELTELVASHALAVYASGLVEPEIQSLDDRDRRSVLAARVGMALAFPS